MLTCLAAAATTLAADQAPTTAPVAGYALIPSTEPPIAAVQQALASGDFSSAIQQASKSLYQTYSEPGSNRYQLFMLKAEGFLGKKDLSDAIDNFNSAGKATQDPREQAVAKWTATLARRSKGGTFVPKSTPPLGVKPAPFDLLNLTARNAALAALLDDELATLKPKLQSASTGQSLPQILPVLKQVQDLSVLDSIANGNHDKTTQIAGDLLKHAHDLIASAIKQMSDRVDAIEKYANQTTNLPQQQMVNGIYLTQNVAQKNGLTYDNKNELKNTIDTCAKIDQAVASLTQFDTTDSQWTAIVNDSDQLSHHANDVLTADYSSSSTIIYNNTGFIPPVLPLQPTVTNTPANNNNNNNPSAKHSK